MEWYIILDPEALVDEYLVISDFHTLRDADGVCWKRTLDFVTISPSDIVVYGFIERNNRLQVFHKFSIILSHSLHLLLFFMYIIF